MTPEVALFEALRLQAINKELSFLRDTRELVSANYVRCNEVMSIEERYKTETVLKELDKRIHEREADLLE